MRHLNPQSCALVLAKTALKVITATAWNHLKVTLDDEQQSPPTWCTISNTTNSRCKPSIWGVTQGW